MTDLVPLEIEGVTVWVEAGEGARTPGHKKIVEAGADDLGKRAVQTADALSGSIRAFCGRVVRSLNELGEGSRPKRAEIEFGLKISTEGNVYIVKGVGEASVKITAEWEFRPSGT